MISIFICKDPWEGYLAYLEVEYEKEYLQYETEEDLTHEHDLAAKWLEDPDQEEWPWYADEPFEIEEPEIIQR